jgi:hypothetical protein
LLINDDYSDKQYALANTLDRMERDQERHFSGLVRQLTQLRFDITAHAKNTTDFQSIMLANKLEAAQHLICPKKAYWRVFSTPTWQTEKA